MRVVLSVAAALLLLVFVVPFFVPWVRLNGWCKSIDVHSGRRRYERFLLGLRVIDRTEETELSQLYRKYLGTPCKPMWRTSDTYSPGVRFEWTSPYHNSLSVAETFVHCLREGRFSEDARRCAVVEFIRLLEISGGSSMKEFVACVCSLAATHNTEDSRPVQIDEVPRAQRFIDHLHGTGRPSQWAPNPDG